MKIKAIIALAIGASIGLVLGTSNAKDTSAVEDAHCLAMNMYHESKWEPLLGKIAVSYVVLNRVRSSKYPNNVCDVVFQGPTRPSWKDKNNLIPIKHRCQFSWYCDGKKDTIYDVRKYEQMFILAIEIIGDYGTIRESDPTNGSLWYHADYVSPKWSKIYNKEVIIGAHHFYSNHGRTK